MAQENLAEGPLSEHKKELNEEKFLNELYVFMKNRDTPIERIPHLGFKQIDLFLMYKTVQKLGGYNQVTTHQLWKQVYNELGGNPRSTSAATCTRRHYEKLILPFEWHLRGKDDKDLPVPRQQKRSRLHSLSEEEEVLRGGKRALSCGLRPQESHDFLADGRMRIHPMPVPFQPYFPHSHPSLPPYHHLASIVQPPHTHLPPHMLPPQEQSECPKQQLVLLRNLAKEYIWSSGWAEPLNLSCKDREADPLSQKPSSFTPTSSSNKMPKFLNKVLPLYSAWNLTKDEGSEGEGNEKAATGSSPRHSPQTTQEQDVIDLSSSSHHSSSLETASSAHMQGFNNLPSQKIRSNALQADAEKPSLPFSVNYPSPKEPTGKMEIQIPLAVLQDLLKGKFSVGPQLQREKGQVTSHDAKVENQAGQRKIPQENGCRVLHLQDRLKERKCSVEEADLMKSSLESKTNTAHPSGKESQRHCHDNLDRYRASLGVQAQDWESECSRKLPQLNVAVSKRDGTAAYHNVYSQNRDYKVQMSHSIQNLQIPDLMLDRTYSQAQSSHMWLYPGSHMPEGEIKELQARAYTSNLPHRRDSLSRQLHDVPLAMSERQATADIPAMFMVNSASPSLMPLTLEEYIKLRRLISSSP